jgi:hypothetical protein
MFYDEPNSMTKPAQFCFAADLFMLQAILKSEEKHDTRWQLEYLFTRGCHLQIIEWLLNNGPQIGVSEFVGVRCINEGPTHVRVVFPNEEEQDKMHEFFEIFNFKRKQAQGIEQDFPPLPDIYQGGRKPDVESIRRYILSIEEAFEGGSTVVEIPSGPNRQVFRYLV